MHHARRQDSFSLAMLCFLIIGLILDNTVLCYTSKCNFENSRICGYKQGTNDDFDWSRSSGKTPSDNTGPDQDHTYKTKSGHYMHIEASSPRLHGDKAHLVSTEQSSLSTTCVRFWYHMHGKHSGSLNVYIQKRNKIGKPLWSKKGNKGNKWLPGEFEVPANSGRYYLVFEGVRGSGFAGDIAIDDIIIEKRPCGPIGKSSVSCDFESSNICGYKQDQTEDFDWTVTSGSTPSQNTGPENDHTLGTEKGKYTHIEASSPRQLGHVARLISPSLSLPLRGGCLQFWYHMYGKDIGTLNVYLRRNTRLGQPVWSKKGQKGNGWLKGEFTIQRTRDLIQVVFEGIRGVGYQGDIAIDDVKLNSRQCSSKTTASCSFDSSGICQYIQDSTDGFDWTRRKGKTSSTDTGPTTDHTFNTTDKGYYMYIEASSPRKRNDVARLMTPEQPSPSSDMCVRFWYNMYGQTIGTLKVYLKRGGNLRSPIWSQTGDKGQKWHLGEFEVPAKYGRYQITFEGIVGSDYHGDIAIDDVTIKQGGCTSGKSGNCTFESGLCSWSNVQKSKDAFDWSVGQGGTPSVGTGPFTDHTYINKTGKFLYIECSSPQKLGDVAILQSTRLPPTKGVCIKFWYHMYGDHVGKLSLSMKSGSSNALTIWEVKGRQGKQWKHGQVLVTSKVHYRLFIHGVCGKGFKGDVSLDDVRLVPGQCSVLPNQAVKEWNLIFRGISGNGEGIHGAWIKRSPSSCTISNGCIPNFEDISVFDVKTKRHLRSPWIDNWTDLNIKQIKLVLYKDQALVMYMVFNGTRTNNLNWFSPSNLIDSNFDDLYSDGCYFKFQLTSWFAYSFIVFQDGHSCDTNSRGWLSVIDNKYSSSTSHPSTCLQMKTGRYPVFRFAGNNHKTKWSENNYETADILAIYVKTT